MADGSDDLERLSREQLILKARVLGVERAELMTRVEMRDEIVRRSEPDLVQQKRARGFLGVARDLVASVVEAGLNLPDAAAIIRGEGARENEWKGPPPVATVTLAEIYAAQGHLDRALRMLDEVLAKEPDHDPARALRDRLAAGVDIPAPAPRRRQKITFADPEPIVPIVVEGEPAPETPPEPAAAPVNVPVPVPVPDSPSPTVEAPQPVEAPEPAAAASEPVEAPEPVEASAPAAAAPVNVPVPVPVPDSPFSSPSLLTLSLSGQRQIYWELASHTWDALRLRAPQGRALLRVISFRTRAGKVEKTSQDLTPDAEVGSAVLPGVRADAVVRAVLGWEADGRFLPFVIASDLSSSVVGRHGPFRAHPLVGSVAPGVEQRALSHFTRPR